MDVSQNRFIQTNKSTISRLLIDGEFAGYILEDAVRELVDQNGDGDFDDAGEGKIWGRTAIPAGVYTMKIKKSGKLYQKYRKAWSWHKGLIEFHNVTGFKSVYLHPGVTADDTDSGLIPGLSYRGDRVLSSLSAYYAVYHKVYTALERGEEVTWTII